MSVRLVASLSGAESPGHRRRPRAGERPRPRPIPDRVRSRDARTPRLDGLTALVIEDHADSREMLRQMVRSLGARPVVARDGEDGLRVLTHERPDVILCDLLMPTMDGFAFLRAFRRSGGLTGVPVIAVTALGGDADYRRTWEAGFDGHLTKPVEAAQLGAVVHAAVQRRRRPSRPDDRPPARPA